MPKPPMKVRPRKLRSPHQEAIAGERAAERAARRDARPAAFPSSDVASRTVASSAATGDHPEHGTPAESLDDQAAGQRRQDRRHAEHQHQQRHQPRRFGAGVQVAHDGARHHHAGAGAEPLDEAEGDQPFDASAPAPSRCRPPRTAPGRDKAAPCGRPCRRSDRRRSGRIPSTGRTPAGSSARRAVLAPRSSPIEGSAGRYMSMANGPMADNRPSTTAVRRNLVVMACFFRIWFPPTGGIRPRTSQPCENPTPPGSNSHSRYSPYF